VLAHPFDWDWDTLLHRPPPGVLPSVVIELADGLGTITNIELDRDLYYTAEKAGAYSGHAGFSRASRGATATR